MTKKEQEQTTDIIPVIEETKDIKLIDDPGVVADLLNRLKTV